MGVLSSVNFKRSIIQIFNASPLYTIGTIQLKVQAKQFKHPATFHVMDNISPYNAILGQEWLHNMRKTPATDKPLPDYPAIAASNQRSNTRETE